MAEADLARLRIDRSATPPARRRLGKWIAALLIAAALGAALAYRQYSAPLFVYTERAATAYPYQSVTLLNAAGYVVAQRKAAVASKATGRLEWLGVSEGSAVRRGELIARLENRDMQAAADQAHAQVGVARAGLDQAQAELRDAAAALGRARELLEKKFIAASALDAAQARFDKAQAGVGAAQAALKAAQAAARAAQVAVEQTLIRAPFDGVVLTKNANVGDVVTPFSSALDTKGAVVTMADMATLEVEADVSESNLQAVRTDQPCEIQLDAFPALRLRGRVARIVPTVDRAKATVMTKVAFVDTDPRVLPEMSAKVAFLSREVDAASRAPVTVVSPGALVEREGRTLVFTLAEGRLRAVPVRVGETLGERVAVEGLAPGETVVLAPAPTLREGAAALAREK